MKKENLITILIILGIIIISILILKKPNNETSEELAKCIGENSVLYVQLGCPHCKDQEELFGKNVKSLNIVDCFYEREKCDEIKATPTWKIKGKEYQGLQTIEKLKELTGC